MIQDGLYRFHPKQDLHDVLVRDIASDQGVRTAIHHKDRTLLEQSVFYLEGCPKPAFPTSFYIRVASSKYPNSYLKWHDNAQFTFEKKDASDDGGFLFRFDFADNNWRNDPKIRTPAGEGWELIGNPVTGKNVDVAGGQIFHLSPVVGWGFTGGDNQQWFAERMPNETQKIIDQSGPH